MEERGLLPEGQNDFVLAYSLSHGLGKFILMQFFRHGNQFCVKIFKVHCSDGKGSFLDASTVMILRRNSQN